MCCGHTCNSRHYKQLKREEKLNSFKEAQAKPEQQLQQSSHERQLIISISGHHEHRKEMEFAGAELGNNIPPIFNDL